MLDIAKIEDGKDLLIQDTIVPKAANVLAVQLGDLEYAPTFGVDKKYFLQDGLTFQNDSFRSYLIERLTMHQITVGEVIDMVTTFAESFSFGVSETPNPNRGLIR